MEKRCSRYVGAACVDGTCPMARAEEYEERCMPVIKRCKDCVYYEGCEDCALAGTAYCEQKLSNLTNNRGGIECGKCID